MLHKKVYRKKYENTKLFSLYFSGKILYNYGNLIVNAFHQGLAGYGLIQMYGKNKKRGYVKWL